MTAGIRVLAVTNHYPSEESPGDTPCIRDQVEALRGLGLQVEVLRIDRTRRRRSYLQVAARLLLMSVRRRRYDLVHAYYGYAGLLALLQLKLPVVVTFRGSDLLSRRNRRLGPAIARRASGVIVMSAEMQRVSRRPDARIVPFGVDLERFAPLPRASARRQLGLPLEGELVLFPWDPSRPEKRFDVAQAAVQSLQAEGRDVRLLTVWNETPATLATHMNACDALVLVSDREGAPMAVREALASRLPVVAVDVGDVRQLIGDVAGCHVCRQDVDEVARSLRQVLSRGQRLEACAVQDARRSAEQVVELYQAILAGGSARRAKRPTHR